jgi:uncharacterized membrane protein YhiD involved in acid resistance
MAEDDPSQVSDVVSRVLAAFEAVSGYTFVAAGAIILEFPSPFLGIDLTPIRTGWNGAAIGGVTILAFCLWQPKTARVAHSIVIEVGQRREKQLVLTPQSMASFWGPTEPPGIQVQQRSRSETPETAVR